MFSVCFAFCVIVVGSVWLCRKCGPACLNAPAKIRSRSTPA
jgi:hypothetical protein